jgi:hypothetical protein
VRSFEVLHSWRTAIVVLVLVASVNLCLYFFYYAPALAGHDEVAPTTTSGEPPLPTTIDWLADSP